MSHITRYNDPFADVHSQLDDIFKSFLGPSSLPQASHTSPAMDIYTEDGKQLVTEVQAPGFTPGDVEITVNNNTLEIRGEKHDKEEQQDKKRSYMLRESHASFYRRLVLPKHADTENIKADFEQGVLKVTVPFKELPEPKKIAIGGGKKK